jgi:hypothetical protein
VVITTEETCPRCRVLVESDPYTAYIAQGPAPVLIRLPDEEMRAELGVAGSPLTARPGQRVTIEVSVKNVSRLVWRASDRSGSALGLSVGNHWLDGKGAVITNDDGRTLLTTYLNPGEMVQAPLIINVPLRSGTYLLEIDLLQESVSWFGAKGSQHLARQGVGHKLIRVAAGWLPRAPGRRSEPLFTVWTSRFWVGPGARHTLSVS